MTRSWLVKALLQGAASYLPGGARLNVLAQERMTKSLRLTEAGFEHKLEQCRRHLQTYAEHRPGDVPPSCVLELGTGWYPIVPIGLLLAGATSVVTVDARSHLDLKRTRAALALYASCIQSGRLSQVLPRICARRAEQVVAAARDETAPDATAILRRLGGRVVVGDVRRVDLPAASVDLFVSNNTLEHIPPRMLVGIMAKCRRLAIPQAVMSHFIDMSDHYAHFDPSITEFNALKYSDSAWRVLNNRLHYQSRLRICDYRRIIEDAGFDIVAQHSERGTRRQLAEVTLARRFRSYNESDLLTLRTWLTALARCRDTLAPQATIRGITAPPSSCQTTAVDAKAKRARNETVWRWN